MIARNSSISMIIVLFVMFLFGNSYSQGMGGAPAIIESISPVSADAGISNLQVTVTLMNLGTPPVPPSDVMVSSLRIGTIEAQNINRNNLTITATIDIPASEVNGNKDVTLTFPGPSGQDISFTLTGGFSIGGSTGGSTDGSTSDPGEVIDVTGNAGNLTYPVVDTGQDKCYNNSSEISMPSQGSTFYGQDGQIDGHQPDYTISSDGLTVLDNVTGLTWTRKADWNNNGTVDGDDKFTYADALAYVATVNAQKLGGYSDWRAPTIKELYSLIDYRGLDPNAMSSSSSGLIPFIDEDIFEFGYGDVASGDRIIDSQWVTTSIYVGSVMNGQEAMFGVNFADGRIKGYPTNSGPGGNGSKTYYLRLCRGNTAYGINNFSDNGDGTITDEATGLMWSQADNGAGVNWEDALAYAQSMNADNYLGYSDWRLPNAKEMHSLVDYSRSPDTHGTAAIDPVFDASQITNVAGQSDYPFYWTSTTFLSSRGTMDRAVYIAFGRGLGSMNGYNVIDVHGAGCQRSDPKDGSTSQYPSWGNGPQGDVQRVFNYVRLVRTASEASNDNSGNTNTGSTDNNGSSTDDMTGEATLFAPQGTTTTYLIDENGNSLHTWESAYRPGLSVYLLDDGSLLRTGSLGGPQGNSVFGMTGGAGGVVEKYDWDGNLTWFFEHNSDDYLLHHDIELLPNGNILMIAWELKTETEALQAGRNASKLTDGELWPDKIIEVEPNGSSGGTIVWEWHVWDHLIQDEDLTKDNYGIVSDHPEKININYTQGKASADWNHINAVDYNEELDQILLTVHNFSEIWIIDHNTTTAQAAGSAGDLLYRWGNPATYDQGSSNDQQLFVPHDGRWIEKGYPGEDDILIFNNGQNRPDGNYSSVDQIIPPLQLDGTYSLTGTAFGPSSNNWTYKASSTGDFYATHISGAHRLENGNTLITDGPAGRFFEVTESGETVWEYQNPYGSSSPRGESYEVFRATRVDLSEIGKTETPTVSHAGIEPIAGPQSFTLNQNYPNPFNPTTSITYSLPNAAQIEIAVFNMQGQRVKTLVSGIQSAGTYQTLWDGTNENGMSVTSGIYLYQLVTSNQRLVKKMSFMK